MQAITFQLANTTTLIATHALLILFSLYRTNWFTAFQYKYTLHPCNFQETKAFVHAQQKCHKHAIYPMNLLRTHLFT